MPQSEKRKRMKESNTNVDISAEVHSRDFSDLISIRCNSKTKEALLRFCKLNGLSICHVWDSLVWAYLTGINQQIEFVNKSPTIELSVVREVKRMRRFSSMAAENYYEPIHGVWMLRDGELNVNGHVIGCGCLKCRR